MAASYPAPAVKLFGETMSLSNSIAYLGLFPGWHQLQLFDPSVAFRLHLNPAIKDIIWYDASATANVRFKVAGGTTTLLRDLTDRASGTGSGTVWDSFTTSDFIYVCTSDIVGGLHFTIKSANDQSNTIVVEYYDGSATWASLTETDNTDTGASMAQTGDVTWTSPTDAVATSLGGQNGILQNDGARVDLTANPELLPGKDPNLSATNGFWWRISFTTAGFGTNTEIEQINTVNKNSSRGYFPAGVLHYLSIDRRHVGSFEAILASGTDTLEVTHIRNAAQ